MGRLEKRKEKPGLLKMPTGIRGFDEMTGGGLPRNRTTLIIGGPGSGKTIFALQTLVNGAQKWDEPGIFVAFEENSRRIIANTSVFQWDLAALEKQNLFFVDAQLPPSIVQAGTFDLSGLLAALQGKAKAMGAKRIVFDGIDVLLALLNDPQAERQELHRVDEWLAQSGMTGIITGKMELDNGAPRYDFMQFMVDCVVTLRQRLVERVHMRDIHILKYRGSGYAANEYPVFISNAGLEVAEQNEEKVAYAVSTERVSTGLTRLDTMLGGGYYRGSSVLISGSPGTSKTTLAGAFVESSARRGERSLYISFDEAANEVMRNLASVGLDLKKQVKAGRLMMHSYASEAKSSDAHMLELETLVHQFQPRAMVIDPLSALIQSGGRETAFGVAKRLMRFCKARGITLVCTSLLEGNDSQVEATAIEVSTIADTWLHLSYIAQAGERNRALTIIKSRGTGHSNQVRELVLTNKGLTLADVYSAGGQVLMGTLRSEKEAQESASRIVQQAETIHKRRQLELARGELEARIQALQIEMATQQADLTLLDTKNKAREMQKAIENKALLNLRSADKTPLGGASTKKRVVRGKRSK